VTVQVNPNGHKQGFLEPGFIGMSFPSGELNLGHFVNSGNLPALLRNLGPGVLRFGGGSVDRSYAGVTMSAADGLAALARSTGWRVLYSVNLGQFNSSRVTADAHRVATALGSKLLAIACGNEPELYSGRVRSSSYNEADYLATDVRRCLKAVQNGAPRTPFAGPDTFRVSEGRGGAVIPTWLMPYAKAGGAGHIPGLALLTVHRYPLSHCDGKTAPPAALLAHPLEEQEISVLVRFMSASATAKVPYVISESNSASCGGLPGVSDTFASALWSADWLALAAERDAMSVELNGGLSGCGVYSPLCQVSSREYVARPVYYGMLFLHMLGTGRMFGTPETVKGPTGTYVVTHSVISSSGVVRVMVQNLGDHSVNVLLRYGRVSGAGQAWYLTAPSLAATSDVRIQGAAVAGNGTFKPGAPDSVTCSAGSCRLRLPAYSSVIVRLPK
jgi:hypothetical protein